MKQKIVSFLSTLKDDIFNVSKYLYDNPEKSFHEYKACNYLTNILKSYNFNVKTNFLNIPTSFCAYYGSGHPKICYICEYDAIEDLGHITGHNLISAMSIAAAISLSKVIDKLHGSIIVLGCPGEFVGSSKITMVKQGVFDDIDVVLMGHPDTTTSESGTSSALLPIKVVYESNSGLSYKKINSYSSLDACLLTFNAITTLSKGLKTNCYINGIINTYGNYPYIIPSKSGSEFYIRSPKIKSALEIQSKIKNFVEAISKFLNIKSDIKIHEIPYKDLITNKTLSRLFSHNLKESGIINIGGPKDTCSGLSLGTVSHVVPCIHPYISIINDSSTIKYSSPEFAKTTISSFAQDKVLKTAQALSLTALDLIEKESLLQEVKLELSNKIKD